MVDAEGQEVQGHPQLHNEFMRPRLKQTNKQEQKLPKRKELSSGEGRREERPGLVESDTYLWGVRPGFHTNSATSGFELLSN